MNTRIKSDDAGLYVRCDGWIARPPEGTWAHVLLRVRATHPAGPAVYVRWDNWMGSVEERWEIEGPYWEHPIEGRGKQAELLRIADREGRPQIASAVRELHETETEPR